MDWNKIGALLHIADLAKQWPNLKAIHDAALAELQQHAEGKPQPKAPPVYDPRKD